MVGVTEHDDTLTCILVLGVVVVEVDPLSCI
jgi:hypothetical protein